LTPTELARRLAAYQEHGSYRKAAKALGLGKETLRESLMRAAEQGKLGTDPVLPGFAIKSVASKQGEAWVKQTREHGAVFDLPAGHQVKGVSALVDAEGRTIQSWIKTREKVSAVDIAETLKEAFKDYAPAASPIPAPTNAASDLLTLTPLADFHVGLFAWRGETGTNWDLKLAERVIGDAIEDLVSRSPASGNAIVLGGGDLIHADSNENKTAKSGNVLQVDGRYQKVLMTACRLVVRAVDAHLVRHTKVTVRILPGNHDEHASVAVAYFLLAWYRNEPRVTVDVDASMFFWHRFGKVMLGATHGHMAKMADMPSIMAHRRAEDWGATVHRFIHCFHLHHSAKISTEGNGVISEVHQTPTPQDAWHYASGFLSGRSMQSISYHRLFGEISRVRVAMIDAANDNEPMEMAA
jgi:transposase